MVCLCIKLGIITIPGPADIFSCPIRITWFVSILFPMPQDSLISTILM